MEKILYLNALELTANNNIHKNQVLPVKSILNTPNFRILFLSPWFILAKKKIGINNNRFNGEADEIKLPLASYNHYLNWIFLPLFLATGLGALLYYIKKNNFRPRVIHTRGYPAGLIAYTYKKLFNRNVSVLFDPRSVYPEEGVIIGRWSYNSLSFKLWKTLEKKIVRASSNIFALSLGMQKHFNKLNSNVHFFPAVVDTKKFYFDEHIRTSARKDLGIRQNEIFLIYTGSIGLWHDEYSLFMSIDLLLKSFPDVQFILYILTGQKVNTDKYEHLPNIKVKTFSVPGKDIPKYLNAADIGLLPGTNKSGKSYDILYATMISSKVQEYLSVGLNVVISNRITEVAKLVSERNMGLIYDNITQSYTNNITKEMVLCNEARKKLADEYGRIYSLHTIVEGYQSEYTKHSSNKWD